MEIGSYFSNIKGLPASPAILPKLIGSLRDPDVTVDDIEKVLKLDMSLSAQVMRLSNSSYFSFGKTSSDLNEAIARIGMEETYKLVSSLMGVELVDLGNEAEHIDSEAIWDASIACAVCMELLAVECNQNTVNAYSIGLFHNLGVIVINQMMGDEYLKVLKKVDDDGVSIRDAELEVFGFNYVAVSSTLLEYWKFKSEITKPILHQYDPAGCSEYLESAAMLHVSLYILSEMGLLVPNDMVRGKTVLYSMGLLGINNDFLNDLVERIQVEAGRINGMLAGKKG